MTFGYSPMRLELWALGNTILGTNLAIERKCTIYERPCSASLVASFPDFLVVSSFGKQTRPFCDLVVILVVILVVLN